MNSVTIKGNKDGLVVYFNSDNYEDIKGDLISKIKRGKDFFTGCNITIVENGYSFSSDLYETLKKELKDLFDINLVYPSKKSTEKTEKTFSGIYEGRTKFYRNTIRSGQRVNYNGNIVIVGDVNSGAEVIASGNIIVLGVLRGIAHAGANGNKRAIVAAYMLQPALLRIDDIITRSPDEKSYKPKMPEVAKLKDDNIVIEPYLPNKYL